MNIKLIFLSVAKSFKGILQIVYSMYCILNLFIFKYYFLSSNNMKADLFPIIRFRIVASSPHLIDNSETPASFVPTEWHSSVLWFVSRLLESCLKIRCTHIYNSYKILLNWIYTRYIFSNVGIYLYFGK